MQDFFTFAEYILAFVVVLSIVVFVHEMGHFLVARLCGVRVMEFSIGFGKKLYSRRDKKGTEWCLRAIPMGGFVQMFGDADATSAKSDKKAKEMTAEEKKVAFPFQPVWKKIPIIFAGPATNYIFAILLMTAIFMTYGQIKIPPVVGNVKSGSPAAAAGLLSGDKILKIDNRQTKEFSDIKRWMVLAPSNEIILTIERSGKTMELKAVLDKEASKRILGVSSKPMVEGDVEPLGFFPALHDASTLAWRITADTMIYLKQVLSSARNPEEMRGPLGIAEASGDAAKGGLLSFMLFLVQISIGIGLINLFPIPMLDGGQIVVYIIEGIRRKPMSEKFLEKVLVFGMVILGCLLLLTLWNDIPRIFGRLIG